MRDFRSFYVYWGGRQRLWFETQRGDWGRDVRLGAFRRHLTISWRPRG